MRVVSGHSLASQGSRFGFSAASHRAFRPTDDGPPPGYVDLLKPRIVRQFLQKLLARHGRALRPLRLDGVGGGLAGLDDAGLLAL